MKNLKQLLLKGFILTSLFLFASCNKDDDGTTTNIPTGVYGSWQRIGFIEDGIYTEVIDECETEFFTFNTDNTGEIYLHDCDFGDQSVEFNWENELDIYTLTTESQGSVQLQVFFEGMFKMHINDPEDPSYKDVYIRIEP